MKYCDGVRDCEDGSDENQCPQNSTDFVEQFMCQNGAKIHKDKVCNGVTDCTDGSDEGNNCPTLETRSQIKLLKHSDPIVLWEATLLTQNELE